MKAWAASSAASSICLAASPSAPKAARGADEAQAAMSWNAREYAPSSSASTTALTAMGRRSRPPRSASSRPRLSSRLWRLSSSRMSVFLVRLRVLRRRVSSMRAIRGAPEARPENGERIQSGISGAGHHALASSPFTRSRKSESAATAWPARVSRNASRTSSEDATP